MLETTDMRDKFSSLKEFEQFNLGWTRACAKLNPTEKNLERLDGVEHRAELLRLEA